MMFRMEHVEEFVLKETQTSETFSLKKKTNLIQGMI